MAVLTLHFCMYYVILCALHTHCTVPPFLLASFTVELEIATCTIPDYRFNMNIFLYWRYNDDSRGFHFLRSVSSFSLSRVVYNFKSFKSIHWPFEHIYLLFRFVSFCLNLSDTDIFDWLETFAQQTCLTCLHFSLNIFEVVSLIDWTLWIRHKFSNIILLMNNFNNHKTIHLIANRYQAAIIMRFDALDAHFKPYTFTFFVCFELSLYRSKI